MVEEAAVLEEALALASVLASVQALVRQAFVRPFSGQVVWALWVAILSAPFVARSALQRTAARTAARAARVVVVARKNLTTRLTGAAR